MLSWLYGDSRKPRHHRRHQGNHLTLQHFETRRQPLLGRLVLTGSLAQITDGRLARVLDPLVDVSRLDGVVERDLVVHKHHGVALFVKVHPTEHLARRLAVDVAGNGSTGFDVVGVLVVVDGSDELVGIGLVHHFKDVEFPTSQSPAQTVDVGSVVLVLRRSGDLGVKQPDRRHVKVGHGIGRPFGVGGHFEFKQEHLDGVAKPVVSGDTFTVDTTVAIDPQVATLVGAEDRVLLVQLDQRVLRQHRRQVGLAHPIATSVGQRLPKTLQLGTSSSQERSVLGQGPIVTQHLGPVATGQIALGEIVRGVKGKVVQDQRAPEVDQDLAVHRRRRTRELYGLARFTRTQVQVGVVKRQHRRVQAIKAEVFELKHQQRVGSSSSRGPGQNGIFH